LDAAFAANKRRAAWFAMSRSNVIKAGKDGIPVSNRRDDCSELFCWAGCSGRLRKTGEKTSALISSGQRRSAAAARSRQWRPPSKPRAKKYPSRSPRFLFSIGGAHHFPVHRASLNLTENQFGIWAAIAIHDTSSVVGASAKYGAEALRTATTVKLARALWIAPIALFFAFVYGRKNGGKKTKSSSVVYLSVPRGERLPDLRSELVSASIFDALINLAKAGLTVTLFSSVPVFRANDPQGGHKPFLQGVLLWMAVSLASLWAIRSIYKGFCSFLSQLCRLAEKNSFPPSRQKKGSEVEIDLIKSSGFQTSRA
jgi:uncharacterized membrane protein YadS